MTTQKTQIENARSQFLNGMINTSAPKASTKQFKHEVKTQGTIHLGWKSPTGAGLHELNAKKKANSVAPKQHVNIMKEAHKLNPLRELRERNGSDSSSSSISTQSTSSSTQADLDRMMMENINAFERNSNVQSKSNPATIDDMLCGGVNDSTPCITPHQVLPEKEFPELPECAKAPALFPKPSKEKIEAALDRACNNSEASSSVRSSPLDHNPVYQGKNRFNQDRFKPEHPSQQIKQPDFTKPAEGYSNLEKCQITHDGSKIEPKMERKHGFQVDPSIKHVKGDIATCAITKGNAKKGVTQPDASHKQGPQSGFSGVNVGKLRNRLIG